MVWFACFVAFWASVLASACGSKVWMALPRLIFVMFVHGEITPPTVAPVLVMSHIKAANPPGMSRFVLCSRTLPGSWLAIAFDEPWPPPAEALFPCVPVLPAAGVTGGWPFPCACADEPRNRNVASARNGTIRRFIAFSSLVRRTTKESGQVETDSKIHRVER